ncbi:MAG TPA: pyridoxal-phosphate dependent enzyme [Candidatus Dormibacteraeota bacterium]
MPVDLAAIRSAADAVRPHVLRTPIVDAGRAKLKLECLQLTGSFKVRGFLAAAIALPEEKRARGLMTVSAGNAAIACAFAANHVGVPCRVVMPDGAPRVKLDGVRRYGAEPLQMPRPQMMDWIEQRMWEWEPEAFIHPFLDETLQAGAGGIGLELLEDVPDLECLVAPVGGGGLITGVGTALKARNPRIRVIGVQSDGYPMWREAFAAGGRVALTPQTIADGTTAPWTEQMHKTLQQVVDTWITVPEPRLRTAIPELAARAKVVAEGAGALAYAALEQLGPGPVTVALVSGGNLDSALLADLLTESSGG